MPKSMRLKYEPSSEPLHIPVEQLFPKPQHSTPKTQAQPPNPKTQTLKAGPFRGWTPKNQCPANRCSWVTSIYSVSIRSRGLLLHQAPVTRVVNPLKTGPFRGLTPTSQCPAKRCSWVTTHGSPPISRDSFGAPRSFHYKSSGFQNNNFAEL